MTTERPRIAGLADGHLEEFLRSGLSAETILKAKIYSASGPEASAILGYGVGPGWVVPYGGNGYARVKLDHAGPDGKRYRSPKGRGNHLYIPPMLDVFLLVDAEQPIYLTEGEKKCLRAAQDGLRCIALSGVWSWRQKGPDGKSVPIPDLELITWAGRIVYIVFDSDLVTKPDVQAAERELAKELTRRGATVFAIRLPAGPDGAKVGLDDYLLTHSVDALRQIEPITLGQPAPAEDAARSWTLHDAADAWDDAALPLWIIEPLLPERGVMWMAGTPHSGKSLLVLYVGLAIVSGQRQVFRQYAIAARPRILFVSREDGRDRLKRRRADILAAWGLSEKDLDRGRLQFLVREPINLLDPADVAELVRTCRAGGHTVLVLDTWTALAPGTDPDSPKEQAALARVVVELAAAIEGLVIVIDHARKNPPANVSLADTYGPQTKMQRAEHAVVLRRCEGEDDRVEVLIDSKDLDREVRFYLDRSPLGSATEKWSYAGSPTSLAEKARGVGAANRERVRLAAPLSPGWASREQIEAATGLASSAVRSHLRALVEGGSLDQAGKSKARRYQRVAVAADPPSRQHEHAEEEPPF
jgi:hypothetical protein